MPVTLYDRSALREAAARRGDENANQMARRLGCGRETAYRLWRGQGAPSAELAADAHREYGIETADLLRLRGAEPEPVEAAESAA